VLSNRSNVAVAAALVGAVFLWGASNAGAKFLIAGAGAWPPIWTGSTRFVCAGMVLLAVTRWTRWLGVSHPLSPELHRRLWWRGGLSLAAYILAFNWALRFTTVSHVALYLGAAPVWAALWEGRASSLREGLQRYGAALVALSGVLVLFWPALRESQFSLTGEGLGLACSLLWTLYGRQCRSLAQGLTGSEISGQTMWRAGVLLLPLGIGELMVGGYHPSAVQVGVQFYCILGGGVVAFAIWAMALRRWPTSKVYLFNNLIPLSTMLWAHFTLDEAVTVTFWAAMALIVAGVLVGQWKKQEWVSNTART
jgi:drug/metabolite transporter (DMT)-like permease